MGYQCPKCSSENIQRVELIYQQGTQTGTMRGTVSGVGIGMGSSGMSYGGGGGSISGTTTNQTALASSVAPPKKQFVVPLLLPLITGFYAVVSLVQGIAGGSFYAAGMGIMFAVILAVATYFMRNQRKKSKTYNQETLPRLIKEWHETWMCHKCGTVFHESHIENASA